MRKKVGRGALVGLVLGLAYVVAWMTRSGMAAGHACIFIAEFANGSLGVFESTRYARGHKALYTFEINGEHASIFWDLHDLHRLQYFEHRDEGRVRGWRRSSAKACPALRCRHGNR